MHKMKKNRRMIVDLAPQLLRQLRSMVANDEKDQTNRYLPNR